MPNSQSKEAGEWKKAWSLAHHAPSHAAAAYAVAAELAYLADLSWSADNPDPEDLIGNELPLIAKSFLLDPNFLPRMSASAHYMMDALLRNDRWPMPRCTADEVNFFAACHAASNGLEDWLEIDAVLSELAAGLSAAEVRSTISDLADDVCDDTDVELLYQPRFDGIEDGTLLIDLHLVNLHPREWFEPFGYVDGAIV